MKSLPTKCIELPELTNANVTNAVTMESCDYPVGEDDVVISNAPIANERESSNTIKS